MVEWTCPDCKGKMYSSYEAQVKKTVKCIYCGKEYENPFYQHSKKKTQRNHNNINSLNG
ncbi:MAG: hypothetical protein Q8920_04400 [Bacillota bacterium]|nr:hypothetical protein [Bacillota bacterium]